VSADNPRFITIEEVAVIHDAQLAAFGGQAGIRGQDLLLSAVSMPEQSYGGEFLHSYPFGMAAAYCFHIAENQPYIDGNKRTALQCGLEFLKLAGYEIDDPENMLYDAMIKVGTHQLSKDGLADMLSSLSRPKPPAQENLR
jgi:death on curing protein